MGKIRIQSAMEYLMTYGWSILIIAIVLAALFELGVFGNGNLGPKVPPGSCHVLRPGGVGSTTNINLEGECNNVLPEYVAVFNGQSTLINLGTSSSIMPAQTMTITAWIDPASNSLGTVVARNGPYYLAFGNAFTSQLDCVSGAFDVNPAGWKYLCGATNIPLNQWSFIAVTYDGANVIVYLNGKLDSALTANGAIQTTNGNTYVGWGNPGFNHYFNGSISNIQIYGTAMDSPSLSALYAEGIGGAPINLQSILGWWPLNGDTNDYSGQYNNGVPTNVIFTTSWTNGYTTP